MDKVQKKIKKEENKFEHEIEKKSTKYETDIEKIGEKDLDILKMEAETIEKEMHENFIEFNKTVSKIPENKKNIRRKRKKIR